MKNDRVYLDESERQFACGLIRARLVMKDGDSEELRQRLRQLHIKLDPSGELAKFSFHKNALTPK